MAQLTSIPLPAQAAGGADTVVIVGMWPRRDPAGNELTTVSVIPPASFPTVTGKNSANNVQLNIRQLRAGQLVATVASLTLTLGVNLTPEVPVTFPLTVANAGDTAVVAIANDVFDVVMHQTGTGQAVPAGLIVVIQ